MKGVIREQPAPLAVSALRADLADRAEVEAVLRAFSPDVVIHSAALADAEVCERHPDRAQRDNVVATRTLARASVRSGARFIAISTDLVFGGEAGLSTEDSLTNPRMEYGRSKVRAEHAALEECPETVILRVGLVCGRGHGPRRTGSETLADRLRRGESVTLYEDEWRTPIDPESVGGAVEALLERPSQKGILHIAGPERLTRVELGEKVAAVLGLDVSLIKHARQASHVGAPRPRDVSLDTGRAKSELSWTARPLEVAIREGRTG